ncbi:MAG: flavodoxin-dependent (E)-4-hydroxy-3-methylbut-2-enyl-diphosphate synthase [bacterium]
MTEKNTKVISIGKVRIGGNNPVAVQSMTKTHTRDVKATISQIKRLEAAGCDIVRCAVPEEKDALAIKQIKKHIKIPLVADIHFNYRLALMAVEAGADKVRINPGNIGGEEKLKVVVAACRERGIPIRIGVNSGSLEKDILKKHRHPTAEALVASALRNIRIFEKMNFRDIVVSIKSTSVPATIDAYRMLSKKVNYPLHIGITEAGVSTSGIIRSSVGIGALLAEGIGDTVRVSLTGDPVMEVIVAKEILKSLELIKGGVTVISCPTCGRCEIDVEKIAKAVEEKTKGVKKSVKIAIMGCAVNGPGEAADADVGLAGGKGSGLIFRSGKIIKKVPESRMLRELMNEVKKII